MTTFWVLWTTSGRGGKSVLLDDVKACHAVEVVPSSVAFAPLPARERKSSSSMPNHLDPRPAGVTRISPAFFRERR